MAKGKRKADLRALPDWERLYKEEPVEGMPWFHEAMDADLERAIKKLGLKGGSALDLGTGPGTQAIALALAGFRATGSDISVSAVKKARRRSKESGASVSFIADDILRTRIKKTFDLVLDRGCFHTMAPENRVRYIKNLSRLLRPGGYLFLKCFSSNEKMEGGPYRFTPAMLKRLFSPFFGILSIKETVYQGTLKPRPKALFSIMQRRTEA